MRRQKLIDLAIQHRIPGSYALWEFVDVGGFMALGPSYPESVRCVVGGRSPKAPNPPIRRSSSQQLRNDRQSENGEGARLGESCRAYLPALTSDRMTMLLKGRRSWQHLSFAHLGQSAVASGPKGQFPPGMANSPGIVRFVTEFTVLTRQLPQYHADGSGEKDPAVPPGELARDSRKLRMIS
jgi:hypothetical protein